MITRGKKIRPRRTMLYGIHGCGKSTWAAQSKDVVFLDIEDGLGDIDCASIRCRTYPEVVEAMHWLLQHPDEFQNVAIDTADWLQGLIFHEVCASKNVKSIEDAGGGYGRGYKFAIDKWDYLITGFDKLWRSGKGIIVLAHAEASKHNPPDGESYDRYQPAMHKAASTMLQEWCDEVLFASFRVFTKTEDLGFNKTRQIAIGGKERYIVTSESAAIIAKNRLGLPEELPMCWADYEAYFPTASNVAGVINNGSSKKEKAGA